MTGILITLGLLFFTVNSHAEDKIINFEQLLIQGQLQRPDIDVVTGNSDDPTNGLLRLREDFLDRISIAAGEEL